MVRFQGRVFSGLVAGGGRRFISAGVDTGNFMVSIHADGYKDGQCMVVVGSAMGPGGPPSPGGQPPGALPPGGLPGSGPPGAVPPGAGPPGAPGAPPGMPPYGAPPGAPPGAMPNAM